MTELTDTQRTFLETYVTQHSMRVRGLDHEPPRETPAEADSDKLFKDTVTLRELMDKFGPPDLANSAEKAELQGLQREVMSFLTPPITKADISAAAKVVQRMRAPHDASLRRIRRDALVLECDTVEQSASPDLLDADKMEITNRLALIRVGLAPPAPDEPILVQADTDIKALATFVGEAAERARVDLEKREEKAAEVRDAVEKAVVDHATETEAKALLELAEKVTQDWDTPPTWDQLGDGDEPLKLLQQAASDLADVVADRKSKADKLRKAVASAKVEGADGDEAAALETARKRVTDDLPEYPSPKQLETAEENRALLDTLVQDTKLAVAARILRRDEILAAQTNVKVEGATAGEQGEINEILARFPDLSGVPAQKVLDEVAPLVTALAQKLEDVRASVAARKLHSDKVVAVLDTLVWGSGALTPDAAVPPAMSEPVKLQAEALIKAYEVMRDPAKPEQWPETATDKLTTLLAKMETDRDEVHAALADVNKACADVQDKLTEVNAFIAGASVHQMSDKQQKAFADQATTAAALLKTVASESAAAIAELVKVATAAKAFKVDLRGLAQRIGAVDLKPAHASPAELAELDKLHKAALADLDKALP
ncbi:hypothetical protein ACERZ8_20210 [Tateyamaria armeniaca]|uniref:Uncharacterized protein n=1 Tax=Tateyamaria armeniaca TaxID=2518930 RepID=A0ABW8UYE8_9RHOB